MPNWMSDEDMSLESGDSIRCEHCGVIYSVDDWHTCQEGIEAGRRENQQFMKAYMGKAVERTFAVTIRCMDSNMSFSDAVDSLCSDFKEGSGSDPVLNYSWTIKQTSGPKVL